MRRTEQFRKQHESIIAMVQEISKKLDAQTVVTDAQDVRQSLSKLAGLVKVHLVMEDKVLYPSLASSSNPKVEALAKQFIDDMGDISQAFDVYNDTWTQKAIREHADGFVRETKGLFGRLSKRIEREDNELFPLADDLS